MPAPFNWFSKIPGPKSPSYFLSRESQLSPSPLPPSTPSLSPFNLHPFHHPQSRRTGTFFVPPTRCHSIGPGSSLGFLSHLSFLSSSCTCPRTSPSPSPGPSDHLSFRQLAWFRVSAFYWHPASFLLLLPSLIVVPLYFMFTLLRTGMVALFLPPG